MATIENANQTPTDSKQDETTHKTIPLPPSTEHAVTKAIYARHSTRAFKPTPIPQAILEECLDLAQHSPSNSNLQPWRLTIVEGPALTRLTTALTAENIKGTLPQIEPIPDSYRHYRSDLGHALYGKEGYNIPRADKDRKSQAERRNYLFFDAPMALIVLMESTLAPVDTLSIGLWLQNLCLLLQERGLGNCIEVSVAGYPDVIRRELGISENMLVLCGVAIGYEDEEKQINHLRSERDAWKKHVTFVRE